MRSFAPTEPGSDNRVKMTGEGIVEASIYRAIAISASCLVDNTVAERLEECINHGVVVAISLSRHGNRDAVCLSFAC